MCLARELLGDALLKEAVLELNASDDRGIDIVRGRIKVRKGKRSGYEGRVDSSGVEDVLDVLSGKEVVHVADVRDEEGYAASR